MAAKDLKRSIFSDALSHVSNLLIHEKLLPHSHDRTDKVRLTCNNLNKLRNFVSSDTIDVVKVAGR